MKTEIEMLFTLNEAATICKIDPQCLRNWITEGIITPAKKGGVGKGNSHRFSPVQLIGLATVGALAVSERRCSHEYAAKVMRALEEGPDSMTVLNTWLDIKSDAYTEEAHAAWKTSTTASKCY